MKYKGLNFRVMLVLILVLLLAMVATAGAFATNNCEECDYEIKTYTLDADFAEGTLVNVNYDDVSDQLQLDSKAMPFESFWVAASLRGTIVRIDTATGNILGEYWSAPNDRGRNPSRTTVDGSGNVWAGNRDEASGGKGSVVKIGLLENGQCIDRNGNGTIETSSGLGDIKPWPNTGGADDNGGVSTAVDECIINYVRTAGTNIRTVAVTNDGSNDVWFGGLGNRVHERHNSAGVPIAGSQFNYGNGGYGGLVDAANVLWSAGANTVLLRYDPVTSTSLNAPTLFSYGLARDSSGNIWNTQWTYNQVRKFNPAGAWLATYFTGGNGSRGIAATADDDMWIANSNSNTVTRLSNSGALLATITVGYHPTGVAVDAAGKVWVTNYNSHNVMRIDPTTNLVDLTVSLGDGAYPYNYSDMTGSTLIAPPNIGTWSAVYDSGIPGAKWRDVGWNSAEPGDSSITVKVAASADGVAFGPEYSTTNGSDPFTDNGIAGQYLKVIVSFSRATTGETPVLYDLTIATNQPPVVAADNATVIVNEGLTANNTGTYNDPEGDVVALTASVGTVANNNDGTWSWSFDTSDGPAESQMVTITAADSCGCCVETSFDLVVHNVAPSVTIDSVAPTLVAVGELVTANGSFTDPGTSDTHTAQWDWGDGSLPTTGTVGQGAGFGSVGGDSHAYDDAGIYTIELTVTDDDGASGQAVYQYVIVYDPSAGFVTGGGWIDSPAGAYRPDPELTGKATFGFVSKYKRGAFVPTGNTEFQFHAADLNFHSSSYAWLVVTGRNFAMFKGAGTINGALAPSGNLYKFMIWAGDDDPDTFRIKIWDEDTSGEVVVYDNGFNQELGSGSIIIHTKK